jgi:hypothetical protein
VLDVARTVTTTHTNHLHWDRTQTYSNADRIAHTGHARAPRPLTQGEDVQPTRKDARLRRGLRHQAVHELAVWKGGNLEVAAFGDFWSGVGF